MAIGRHAQQRESAHSASFRAEESLQSAISGDVFFGVGAHTWELNGVWESRFKAFGGWKVGRLDAVVPSNKCWDRWLFWRRRGDDDDARVRAAKFKVWRRGAAKKPQVQGPAMTLPSLGHAGSGVWGLDKTPPHSATSQTEHLHSTHHVRQPQPASRTCRGSFHGSSQ